MTLVSHVQNILFSLLVVITSLLLGRKLLRAVYVEFTDGLTEFVFTSGAGLGCLAILVTFLGVLSLLYKNVFYVCFLFFFIVLRKDLKQTTLFLCSRLAAFCNFVKQNLWLASPLVICAMANFFATLAPPSGDVTSVYINIPKLFLKVHHIGYLWDNLYSHAPMYLHMLQVLGIGLGSAQVSQLTQCYMGMLLAASIIGFAREFLDNERVGLLAASLLYSCIWMTWSLTNQPIDTGYIFFAFLGTWSLFKWVKNDADTWIALAGLFIGLAVGSKYWGVFLILPVVCVIVCHVLLNDNGSNKVQLVMKNLLIFILVALPVASPWYVRNVINTGNPLFPALYSIFGGNWSPVHNAVFLESSYEGPNQLFGNSFLLFMKSPWLLTFHEGKLNLGPIYLMSIPAIFAFIYHHKDKRRVCLLMVAFICLFYTQWYWLAFQLGRHLLPVIALFSILAVASILFVIENGSQPLKLLLTLALALILLLQVGTNLLINMQFFPVVVGLETEDNFLKRRRYYYPEAEWINKKLPENAVVALDTNILSYFLDRKSVVVSPVTGVIDWTQDVAHVLKDFRRHNITHFFLDEHNSPFCLDVKTVPEQELRDWWVSVSETYKGFRKHLRLVYSDDRKAYLGKTLHLKETMIKPRIYEIEY